MVADASTMSSAACVVGIEAATFPDRSCVRQYKRVDRLDLIR